MTGEWVAHSLGSAPLRSLSRIGARTRAVGARPRAPSSASVVALIRRHRVTVPESFAARLSAEGLAELRALQAGIDRIAAAQAEPEPPDPWQLIAELAQWYLLLALEPAAADVFVDADRCTFMLHEAAAYGCTPTPEGIAALQQAWLGSARWPCFPGERTPPLLRGG